MSYTVEDIQNWKMSAEEVRDMLIDAIDAADEWLGAMGDDEADDDDKGMAQESFDNTLDELAGNLLSLSQITQGVV